MSGLYEHIVVTGVAEVKSVSTIAPPQTMDCMSEKMKSIYRYRRPNWKRKSVIDLNLQ